MSEFESRLTDQLAKIIADLRDPELERRILIRATAELADRVRAYPGAGAWNREPGANGNGRWYQRGYGVRWRKKGGDYGGRNTSADMQSSWSVDVAPRGEAFFGNISTGVSYAPFLLDPSRQVSWAKSHGWQSVDAIIAGYGDRFAEIAIAEIDKGKNDV